MICERCGRDMQDNTTICPFCGSLTQEAKEKFQSSTAYGDYPQSAYAEPSLYEQGYKPLSDAPSPPPLIPPAISYLPPPPPKQKYGYAPPSYQPAQTYTPPINITIVQNNKDGALIAEILFSLFGIFGVGWLIGGETSIGIVLLICSFLVYWPIIFLGTLMTFGFGLICLGPLAIGAIILNAILLNKRLSRKAQYYVVQPPPQPHMHMPPPPQRPR